MTDSISKTVSIDSSLDPTSLATLANWMSGTFENLEQSRTNPTWFVALRWWCRPLPERVNAAIAKFAQAPGAIALFAEQAPLPDASRPYRQRLILLCPAIGVQPAYVRYFGFEQPLRWRGAGTQPELLEAIQPDDLQVLVNDRGNLTRSGDRFSSRLLNDQPCEIQADQKLIKVKLGFDISQVNRPNLPPNLHHSNLNSTQSNQAMQTTWHNLDCGIDPDTDRPIWGAMMGAYELIKTS